MILKIKVRLVILKQKRHFNFNSSYLGPEFSDDEIEKILKNNKISYEKLDKRNKILAKLLSEKNIIAVFKGKAEFGERALGNRSILADPRDETMKDKINSMIKYREEYRPFAPSVIHEESHKYFEVPKNYECFFMEKVIPVKESFRDKLPAITHVDGTARLHTVKHEHNESFYGLLNEFKKITSFPILLNTSFNTNGEPIVNTPNDALKTFSKSGLEYLALNDFLIKK